MAAADDGEEMWVVLKYCLRSAEMDGNDSKEKALAHAEAITKLGDRDAPCRCDMRAAKKGGAFLFRLQYPATSGLRPFKEAIAGVVHHYGGFLKSINYA